MKAREKTTVVLAVMVLGLTCVGASAATFWTDSLTDDSSMDPRLEDVGSLYAETAGIGITYATTAGSTSA